MAFKTLMIYQMTKLINTTNGIINFEKFNNAYEMLDKVLGNPPPEIMQENVPPICEYG